MVYNYDAMFLIEFNTPTWWREHFTEEGKTSKIIHLTFNI